MVFGQTVKIDKPTQQLGCPINLIHQWFDSDNPEFEPPNLDISQYSTKLCFECSTGICDIVIAPFCPPCFEIIKLDYVFNPRNNTYEVVYRVISRLENGNTQTFYTYAVYKVPVWELDQNGNRVKIIGYKYYYKIIPELIAIVLDPINGHLKMNFE